MPPINPPRRVLVIRNDKLGDFMLACPSLALLRRELPDAHVTALVTAYTAPMAKVCPYIDDFIVDKRDGGEIRNAKTLAACLKPRRFDAVITLFSRFDTALAVWLAGIPTRLAPATKVAQVFYNRRLHQRRSRSERPEYAYNLELVQYYLASLNIHANLALTPPYLQFPHDEVAELRRRFTANRQIPAGHQLVFIHSGSGGSANNLTLGQFAELARRLHSSAGHTMVLTAGPGEEGGAQRLSRELGPLPHTIYRSRQGLIEFARHVQFADLFISGSTGPLHLAGALNRQTAAFYPRRRSSTALRWQTINAPDRRLAFSPPEGSAPEDMGALDVGAAADTISREFLEAGDRGPGTGDR
jgi:ADP-heptose:LPS heptosyltransferase